jgi:hypothetical protein
MQQIRDLLGFDLNELAGAHVSGEVPLNDSLLNRLIAERISASQTPVETVVVEPHNADRLTVHLQLRASLVPRLKLHLQIEQQPEFPASPVLVLRWSLGGLAGLARLASPVLSLLDVLPPGVRVQGDLVGVDIAEIIRARGFEDALRYIRSLRVSTQEGRVMVAFDLRG